MRSILQAGCCRRWITGPAFPAEYFSREDESDDGLFYTQPRFVVHIDELAIAAVGRVFREQIPADSVVLDLMSSWRSHWPADHAKKRLVGLGMNAAEMADNPDLDDYVVHDLNQDPELPFGEDLFDAVVVTVSVQYLTRPIETFQQVNRVLKPGGVFIVTFSNRMFPTKAVRLWRGSSDQGHLDLVGSYLEYAGEFEDIKGGLTNPEDRGRGDPLFAVIARKIPTQQ